MSVLKSELPDEYVISNPITGENAGEFWANVRNSDSISIDSERLEKFHGCPFIVGIDIFQLDYLPRDIEKEQELAKLFHLVWTTVRLAKKKDKTDEEKKDLTILLDEIERECRKSYSVKFNRSNEKELISELIVLANKIASSVPEDESDEMVTFISYENRPYKRNPKSYFDQIVWLPFENINVPVPASWEELLPRIYKDYMVPKRQTQAHDYPFYKRQLDMLREKYNEMIAGAKSEL